MSSRDAAAALLPNEGPDQSSFLLKARILGALALAATGIPCLHAAAVAVREAGGPKLTSTAGAWLALALVVYLPLYLDSAKWPARSAQGSCLWTATAVAWCLADLGQLLFATDLLLGFAILLPVSLPVLGWILLRWVAPPQPFKPLDWLFGLLPGGFSAAAFAIGGLVISAILAALLQKAGPAFAAVVELLPACGALLGLKLGLDSATTPTEPVA